MTYYCRWSVYWLTTVRLPYHGLYCDCIKYYMSWMTFDVGVLRAVKLKAVSKSGTPYLR